MTFSDVRILRRGEAVVSWCSNEHESIRRRQEALQARSDAVSELLGLAAGVAPARGGDISARALVAAVDEADRDTVVELLKTVGLEV